MKKYRIILFALLAVLICSAAVTAQGLVPDTWTCVNGHEGNTGKFCTECGAPKPAPETWTSTRS